MKALTPTALASHVMPALTLQVTPQHRDWLCGWDEAEALDFEDQKNPH